MYKKITILSYIIFCLCLTLQAQEVSIAKYKGNKQCAISYTFDDGLSDQYTIAYPELEKRGFKATFFVTGSKINSPEKAIIDSARMHWSQLSDMAEHGHEISNHGWAHKNITKLDMDQLQQEVSMGDDTIERYIGSRPVTYAFPGNRKYAINSPDSTEKAVMRFMHDGRVGLRMSQVSWGFKNKDVLGRYLSKTLQDGEWLVTMTHGILSGYDAFIDPTPFWEHLDQVKAQEDKIWVATFAEVAAYVAEREATTLDIERAADGLKITPNCQLDKGIYRQCLTLVVKYPDGHTDLIDIDPFGDAIIIR